MPKLPRFVGLLAFAAVLTTSLVSGTAVTVYTRMWGNSSTCSTSPAGSWRADVIVGQCMQNAMIGNISAFSQYWFDRRTARVLLNCSDKACSANCFSTIITNGVCYQQCFDTSPRKTCLNYVSVWVLGDALNDMKRDFKYDSGGFPFYRSVAADVAT